MLYHPGIMSIGEYVAKAFLDYMLSPEGDGAGDDKKEQNLDDIILGLQNKSEQGGRRIATRRNKHEDDRIDIRVSVQYQASGSEERFSLRLHSRGNDYSLEISREKPQEDEDYEFAMEYRNDADGERLTLRYNLRDYSTERERALQDHTGKIDKVLHLLPKSIMGGVLGYTYLGGNFMARRDDLVGEEARMVDIHEAIHTPDEYETRVLTSWMMDIRRPRYRI